MVDVIQAIINSVFTGLGVSIGITIHDIIIKPRIKKMHKKIRRYTKWLNL